MHYRARKRWGGIQHGRATGGRVAKRFTDTEKWKHPWFVRLEPRMKCAWLYILDHCDGAGVWRVCPELMSFQIGATITQDDLQTNLADRVVWLSNEKLWVPSFITFQYQNLKVSNRAQVGIMRKVIEMTSNLPLDGETKELVIGFQQLLAVKNDPQSRVGNPPIGGQLTPQETDTETYTDTETDKGFKKGGAGENQETPPRENPAVVPGRTGIPTEVKTEWEETLKHYGRDPNWMRDEVPLFQVYLKVKDWTRIKNALAGYRFEKADKKYNPAHYVYLNRLTDKDSFAFLENLGEAGLKNNLDAKAPEPTFDLSKALERRGLTA